MLQPVKMKEAWETAALLSWCIAMSRTERMLGAILLASWLSLPFLLPLYLVYSGLERFNKPVANRLPRGNDDSALFDVLTIPPTDKSN